MCMTVNISHVGHILLVQRLKEPIKVYKILLADRRNRLISPIFNHPYPSSGVVEAYGRNKHLKLTSIETLLERLVNCSFTSIRHGVLHFYISESEALKEMAPEGTIGKWCDTHNGDYKLVCKVMWINPTDVRVVGVQDIDKDNHTPTQIGATRAYHTRLAALRALNKSKKKGAKSV